MSGSIPQPGEHGGGDDLPSRLRERSQWVVTKDKEPKVPSYGWQKPNRQLSFSQACKRARQRDAELAFALHPNDPFIVIDFDRVGPADSLPHIVEQVVDELDTYTEVSRSGRGLHLICEGAKLPDRKSKADLNCQGSVDVFDAGQFVVLTGDIINASPVRNRGDELINFQREYLPERKGTTSSDSSEVSQSFSLKDQSGTTINHRADDIRRTIREYAVGGSEGAQRAWRLWQSSATSDASYHSPSEADLALCSDLAFWCQEDARLMDRCFRESNRSRKKWDEIHYADGRTYGEATIQTAIRTNYDTYTTNRYVIWE